MDRCPGNGQSSAVSQLWGPKASPWNWTLPPAEISFLLASGLSWASRNFNRLSGVTIRQVSIHYRWLELLPPRPSTVMSASHTQFRFLCPKSPIWVCLVLIVVSSINKTLIKCVFIKFILLVRRKSSKRFQRCSYEKVWEPLIYNHCFFKRCLRLGSQGVHQTQTRVVLKKVWKPLI